jgi:hypothetical protein
MPNLLIIAAAALIPMVMGFIWYNPKVLGPAWIAASGLSEEKLKGANMPLIFGLSYLFSFMLALAIAQMVIHQGHVMSILINEPGINEPNSEVYKYYHDFMAKYGNNFRTFKHGVFHGILSSLFIVLPILATNAMFERKGFKYIAINVGYWTISMALMGGVICQFA